MTFVIKPISSGSAGDTPMKVPEFIPSKSFMMAIIGMRGSGKSVLVSNLLNQCYLNAFEYIVILSPSIDLNDDFDFIDEKPDHIKNKVYKFSKIKDFKGIIEEVLKSQNDLIKDKEVGREECPNTLLILDDCVDSQLFHWGGIIEKIALRGRHSKISCIITSQHMASVSRKIRLNSDMLILFPCINMTEIEQFILQYLYKRYHKKGMVEIERIFGQDYNFVVVNNNRKACESKLYEQFETPIEYK